MPTISRTKRNALRALVVVAVLLAVALPLYALCLVLLFTGAEEGDVPPASSTPPVPAGATIVGQEELCASGGCWWEIVVRPEPGQTPLELAAAMGVDETVKIPGHLWDPRTITVESDAESARALLTVVARYWGH